MKRIEWLKIFRFSLVHYLVPNDFASLLITCKECRQWKFSSTSLYHWSIDVNECSYFIKRFKPDYFFVFRDVFPRSILRLEYIEEKEELERKKILSSEVLDQIKRLSYRVSWIREKQKYHFCLVQVETNFRTCHSLSIPIHEIKWTLKVDPSFVFDEHFVKKLQVPSQVIYEIKNQYSVASRILANYPYVSIKYDTLKKVACPEFIHLSGSTPCLLRGINWAKTQTSKLTPTRITVDDTQSYTCRFLETYLKEKPNGTIDRVVIFDNSKFRGAVFPFVKQVLLGGYPQHSYEDCIEVFQAMKQYFPNAKLIWIRGTLFDIKNDPFPLVNSVVSRNWHSWTSQDILDQDHIQLKKFFIEYEGQEISLLHLKRQILLVIDQKKCTDKKWLFSFEFEEADEDEYEPKDTANYVISNWLDVSFFDLKHLFSERRQLQWYICEDHLYIIQEIYQPNRGSHAYYQCSNKQLI